jgi:hypothetical protein
MKGSTELRRCLSVSIGVTVAGYFLMVLVLQKLGVQL